MPLPPPPAGAVPYEGPVRQISRRASARSIGLSAIARAPGLRGFRVDSVPGDPRDGGRRRHRGWDAFPGEAGPEWYTDRPVEVRNPRTGGRQGITADYVFDDGATWTAMHLRDWPREGRHNPGDLVGVAGNTGNAATTPAHFHLEGRDSAGNRLDPFDYFGQAPEAAAPRGLRALGGAPGRDDAIPPPPAGAVPYEGDVRPPPGIAVQAGAAVAVPGFVPPSALEQDPASRRAIPVGEATPEGMATSFPEAARHRILNYLPFVADLPLDQAAERLNEYARLVMRDYGYTDQTFPGFGNARAVLADYRRGLARGDRTSPGFGVLEYGPDGQPLGGALPTLDERERALREALARQSIGDPRTNSEGDFQTGRFVENVGNVVRGFSELIGHPDANRIGREITRTAELFPVTGGVQLIQDAGPEARQGDYGTAIAMAGLGAADFIPGAGPFRNALRGAGEVVENRIVRETIQYDARALSQGQRHLQRLERRYSSGQYDLPADERARLFDEIAASRARLEGMERSRAAGAAVPVEYELPSLAARAAGRDPATGARVRGGRPATDQADEVEAPDITVTAANRGAAPGSSVDDAAPAAYGSLSEFSRDGRERFLLYRDPNGQEAHIHVVLGDDGRAEISVDPFSTNPNRFGASVIRDAARQLREMYPEIRTLYGPRQSGASPGRHQEVDLSNLGLPSRSRAGAGDIPLPPSPSAGRVVDRIDIGDVPPPPPGAVPLEANAIVRPIRPEDVVPVPGNRVEHGAELPSSFAPMEGPPSAGRRPARPEGFSAFLRARMADESARLGVPVRIDAEDAIDRGVPAELIYRNPGEADRARRRLINPSLFGTRYGRMSRTQQVLRSLDMDDLDPVEWGFDAHVAGRLEPEDIGDLLRRDLEGDPSALRRGGAYDEWASWQARAADRADFEGRFPDGPPVERAGQPITREDLDALTPPDSAYEDAPRFVGRVGNLNLHNVENPEQVSRLVQAMAARVRINPATREVVTNEETRLLARDLDTTPEKLLAWRRGQGLPNAEQIYAIRAMVHNGRQRLVDLARRTQGASDADVARFHNMIVAQARLEAQLAGITRETGRALQQYRMLAQAGDDTAQAIKAYLRGAGGRQTVEQMAEAVQRIAADPAALGRFIREAPRTRKRDMVNELWINSLLSGPKTHVVNFVSNMLTAAYTLPEQALTAGIGRLTRSSDRVVLREVGARAAGLIEGARDGLAAMRQAWRTGEPLDGVSKVEARNYQAIRGRAGRIIRTPTRALTAADEFWKAVNRRAATNALAYRRAFHAGRTPEARQARYLELRNDPDRRIRDAANDEALYYTFQTPLQGLRGLQNTVNDVPGLKFILPFLRTPANLLRFAAQRNVATAWMFKDFRQAMREGGVRRDEALARVILGTGLSAWMVAEAAGGRISGSGPSDPREREALLNAGWQPHSVRIGDRWVSYQRFDPFSMLIGAAADFAELARFTTEEEGDRFASALGIAIARNITSKTWLSGLSDFFEALTDPERHGERFIQRTASSFLVPAISAHAADAIDPHLRSTETPGAQGGDLWDSLMDEAHGVLNAVRQRLPVVSHGLDVRLNVWGEPINRGSGRGAVTPGSAAYDFLSPIVASRESDSPLLGELARLRARVSRPQRSITINRQRVRLSPEQYQAYVELSGQPARRYLEDYVRSDAWRSMTDTERREFISETMTDFRAQARDRLRERFPELDGGSAAPAVTGPIRAAPANVGPSRGPAYAPRPPSILPPRSPSADLPPPPPGAVPYDGPIR